MVRSQTMHALRRVKASLLSQQPMDAATLQQSLSQANVPISEADCRTCSDPCAEGHEDYPGRFDVDMETEMLGSVKPYSRQFVISTGKEDWAREVTDVSGSMAQLLSQAENLSKHPTESTHPPALSAKGVFSQQDTNRIAVLNGSHHSLSHDPDLQTVLVFPEYKLVEDVPSTAEAAHSLLNSDQFTSHPLKYSCVILLCSHKRRDNRCSIAARTLEHSFSHSLASKGWTVYTDVNEHSSDSMEGKSALILKNSHTGGHKYAGNCIIYTPQGSGIWYGRVQSHHVDAIVSETLEEGKILPELLRGGLNISTKRKSLLEW